MIERKDIDTLAELCRLELSAEEKAGLQKDLAAILAYVSELGRALVPTGEASEAGEHRNVMRADDNHWPAGEFTDKLLAAAPAKERGYIKVKPIFGESYDA